MTRRTTQAVVLIHGIGEQRPMSTVRGFCEAVLPTVTEGPAYFSRPDRLSASFELRTLQNRAQPRTHFFELYWAHHAGGTRTSHVLQWLTGLLLRSPRRVPRGSRGLWWLTWSLVTVAAVAYALSASPQFPRTETARWIGHLTAVALVAVHALFVSFVGDAARYLSPSPGNIALRHAIRRDGVELLQKLHDARSPSGAPLYDRIVVVGHSLGSVIAYDILRAHWQRVHETYLTPRASAQEALSALETSAGALDEDASDTARAAFRECQRALRCELLDLGHPWRVTDLVTVGSPLAHAALLLARDEDELGKRQSQRELPTCPPVLDEAEGRPDNPGCSFRVWEPYTDHSGGEHKLRALHHAALFAVTRWTNLYVPTRAILFGDFVGGPLRPYFGRGIQDVPVTPHTILRSHTPWAHVSYWSAPRDSSPTRELVAVLGLGPAGGGAESPLAAPPGAHGRTDPLDAARPTLP